MGKRSERKERRLAEILRWKNHLLNNVRSSLRSYDPEKDNPDYVQFAGICLMNEAKECEKTFPQVNQLIFEGFREALKEIAEQYKKCLKETAEKIETS